MRFNPILRELMKLQIARFVRNILQLLKIIRNLVFSVFFLTFSLGPIYWLIQNSIKLRSDIFSMPPVFIFTPVFDSWRSLITRDAIRESLLNSFIVASLSTVMLLFCGALAAYSLSRFDFPGRRGLLLMFVTTRLMPPITAVIMLYLILGRVGLIDTRIGLVIIYSGLYLPLAIWMLKNTFDSVPKEIEESAQVEGTSHLGAVMRVTLPVAAPSLAASSLLLFINCWNEYMFASLFTRVNARTMTVTLTEALGEFQIYWGDLAAMSTVLIIPVLILSIILQRYLVKGLSAGALK